MPTPASSHHLTRSEGSAIDDVESYLASCSDSERVVLQQHSFAATPVPLDELAPVLRISAAQTARVEKAARARAISVLAGSESLSVLRRLLREHAHPVASSARVARSFPELTTYVPSLDVPLWVVVDRLDDGIDIDADWIAVPSAAAARDAVVVSAVAHATSSSLSSLFAVADDLRMPAEELAQYVAGAGFRVCAGHLVPDGLTVPDQLDAYLTVGGAPTTMDDLMSRLQPARSESAVRNALVTDPRFVKTDRTLWALSRWRMAPYVPIHRQIAKIVDERGSIPFDELVAEIVQSYDVKEFSIRTYASTGEFVIENNVVSRRRQRYTPRKSPSKTKHLYRDGPIVRWRTTVAPVHRRGSAFNLPSALAALLDVGPGSPREFTSRLGPQSVIWVSVQARSGTIKRFVDDMDLADGDDIFLEFGVDGSFDITRAVTTTSDPLRASVQRVGRRPSSTPAENVATIADALWLDRDARIDDVIAVLRSRREVDLVTALTQN